MASLRCTCAFLIVGLVSQTALAQRSSSRPSSLVSVAANEAVQKHLNLPAEAVGRLNAINDDCRAAVDKALAAVGIDYFAIRDLPAAERVAEMRKASEVNRKLAAAYLPK